MEESMMQGIGRRQFLTGSLAVGAAVVAGSVGLSGCAPKTEKEPSSSQDVQSSGQPTYMQRESLGEPSKTITTDFVICGAGGCGTCAGIEARNLGLDVICLEKQNIAGGTFGFSEVTFAVGSHYQKDLGINITVDEVVKECLEFNHYIPSPDLYRTFVAQTADTIDWVESMGCSFSNVMLEKGHFYAGDHVKGAGHEFIATLVKAAEDKGVEFMYETSAKELVYEEGRVTGVLAVDSSGTVIKVEAKAVLLSTGGWANNADMLRELGGVDPDHVTASGYIGRDGDGIIMGRSIGANFARNPENIMFYGPLLRGASWGSQLWVGTMQPTLWVNDKGKRFTNEQIENLCYLGQALRDQKRVLTIATQADLDYFAEVGPWKNGGGFVPAGEPMTDFKDQLQKAINDGNESIIVADTIEELAEKAAIDADTFAGTVERYNELAAAGADSDYGKDAKCLTPLKEGPFYAFESNDAFYTTVGGLRVNERMEVIDEEGEAIKGLYAGGCDAGGLYGDTYGIFEAMGSQSSWAMNSGRLAAKQVAKLA